MALREQDRWKLLDCERKGVLALPDGALKVWFCYWMFQNEAGASFPGNDEILEHTRQSEPTLIYWRKYLVASRWLIDTGMTAAQMYTHPTRGAHSIKVYRVNDPTKEPDWKGWEYWDAWKPEPDGIPKSGTRHRVPKNGIPKTGTRSADAQQTVSGRSAPAEDLKVLSDDDLEGKNVLPQNSLPNIGLKTFTQSSYLSSGSVSDLCSGSDSESASTRSLANQQAPAASQPASEQADAATATPSNATPQIEDNTLRQDRGALPHTPAGETPAPPCGRMVVSESESERLDPEFQTLTPESLCADCKKPIGQYGGGAAEHNDCLPSRPQWFWMTGRPCFKLDLTLDPIPVPQPPSPAAPDHLQEAVDHLTAAGQRAGKRHVQYFPDGAAYPDSWCRLSDEEKRVFINQHKRPKQRRAKVSTS